MTREINYNTKTENTQTHGGQLTCYYTKNGLTMRYKGKKSKYSLRQMKMTTTQNLWETRKAAEEENS